ncbi:MAG: alpha/beta hydrolase [Candidatus Sumerlaeota bacterium]|nr:alpha/beta hydrolase [Candidatus Sumerlaeota bacterium]
MKPVMLVLLPGLDGTGILFEPLLEVLPPEILPKVVAYPPDQPLDYEALLPQVLASLPEREPFVLLGESFSGPLAVMAASRRPPNLRAVVLCATFVRNPIWFLPRWSRFLCGSYVFWFFPLMSKTKALLNAIFGFSNPQMRALIPRALKLVKPSVFAARGRAALAVDATEQLRACQVPILYLAAKFDGVVPAHNLAYIQRQKPSVKAAIIPTGHMLLQSRPREACAALLEFLQSDASDWSDASDRSDSD